MAIASASPIGGTDTRTGRLHRAAGLRTGLVVALFTTALCLGAIEYACYMWEQATAQGPLGWTLVGARRLHLQRHGTTDMPYYKLRPDDSYNWTAIPVQTNSRGFRTQEFSVPKSPGTFRVLNLGDSVVFGWSVRQEETYGKQLEQALNARSDGRRYEVINAGTPGWNTEDERNFLLQEGFTYQPDVVVLEITLVNDIYGGVAEAAAAEEPTLANWMRDHTYTWPMLTTQGRLLLSGQRGMEAIPVLNPPRDAAAYFPLDEHDPHWDRWWSAVEDMRSALQERGIRLVLLPIPTAFQYASDPHPDTPQRVLEQRTEAPGVELVDLLPTYRQACREAGPSACDGFVNLLSADVWMHPTPFGHRLAADALGARL